MTSLIRPGSTLSATHETIAVRTLGHAKVDLRLEIESLTGTLAVKALGCWQKGPWDSSTDVWVGGSALSSSGVHVAEVNVPPGCDTLRLRLEPSQSCKLVSCDLEAVR